jgi:hypothetical protein
VQGIREVENGIVGSETRRLAFCGIDEISSSDYVYES